MTRFIGSSRVRGLVRGGIVVALAIALLAGVSVPAFAQTTVGGSGSDSTYSTNVTSGSLTKIGTNTVTLTGSNTYGGGTFINAGTLQFASAGNIGTSDITLNGGTAAYTGVTGTITRQVAVAANSGFAVTSGSTLTWLGNFNGNGKLTLTGPGTLVLAGGYDNTVNGIRVESGTLRSAHSANYFLLGYQRGTGGNIDSSPLEIGAAGTVCVEGTDNFQGGVTRYTTTTYANTPVQIEGGLMTFVDPGSGMQNNTLGKFTFINGGTLDIQTRNRVDLNSLGGIVSSGSGVTTITGGGTLNIVKRASGDTPTIDVAAAAPLTISAILDSTSQGSSTGGLGITKTGSGTLTLTAANSYGATTITAGVIQVGNGGATGSLGSGAVTNNSSLVFNRGGSLTMSSAISGTGSVTNTGTGTVVLSGNNSYSGGTTITSGTMQVGSSTAFGTGSVVNNSQISVNSASDFTVGNAISGTGSISKAGAGTLTLSGTSTFSGGVTIAAGGVSVASGVSLGSGTVRFTAPSSFTVTGTAATFANGFDLGSVSGSVTLTVPDTSATVINGPITGGAAGTTLFFNNATGGSAGVLTLNGTNSFQGTLYVNRGPVVLGNASAAGASLIYLYANNNPLGDLQFGAGGFTIGNNVHLVNAAVANWIGVPAGQTNGISGTISGNGFTKIGAGTLVLAADNSYSGGTTFTSGTVQVGNGGAAGSLGSGAVSNGGSLVFNRSGSVTVAGAISGTGSLVQAGPGATVLTGGNTYTGATTISSGTLQVGSGGSGSTLGGAGSITNNGSLVFNIGDAQTLSRAVTGSGGLAMIGSGTLTLSGTNAYSAGTTIGGGMLAVSGTANVGAGPIAFTAPATLNVSSTSAATFANSVSIAPSGQTTFQKQSSGPLEFAGSIGGGGTGATLFFQTSNADTSTTFTLSGSNSFRAGTINLNRGNLVVANVNALGDPANLLYVNPYVDTTAGNVRFAVSGTFANPVQLVLSPSSIETGTTDVVLTGLISGNGLYKLGGGRLTLAGTTANAYTTTNITSGTLQVGTGGAAGSLGSGDVTNNGALVFNRGGSLTVAGAISGTGSLTQAGAGATVLTGGNTYAGATTISSGTLQVGSGGSGSTLGGSGSITNNGSLVFNIGDSQTLSRSITGSGDFTKSGGGTLTLGGTNTYSGGTTISGGTLSISGTSGIGTGQVRFTAPSTLALTSSTVTFGNAFDFGSTSGTITLMVSTTSTTIINGPITGGGAGTTIMFNNPVGGANTGVLTLNGTNSFQGNLLVYRGPLVLGNGSAAGASTLQLNGNNNPLGDLQFGAGGFTIPNNVQLVNTGVTNWIGVPAGQTNGISGVISGNGFTKIGAGTLVLAADNSYSGGTTFTSGTVQVGNGGAAGSLGSGNVSNGGVLVFNRSGSLTVGGIISGTGSLVQAGSGTTTLSAASTYTGGTVINAGAIAISSNNTLPDSGAVTINNGGTLRMGTYGDYFGTLTMNGNATVSGTAGVGGGQFILTTGQPGNSTMKTLTATGTNNRIDVNIGISSQYGGVGGNSNLEMKVISASDTLLVNGVIADKAFDGGGNATSGALTKSGSGTLILAGDNTYTGGLTILGGTVQVGIGGTVGNITGNAAAISNNGTIVINRADGFGLNNAISGSGSLIQAGSGTTTVSGANTYTGDTVINAGVLLLASANRLPDSSAVTIAGGRFDLGAFSDTVGVVTLANGAITNGTLTGTFYDVRSGTISATLAGTGALTKSTAGLVTLTGSNTFTGATTISGGVLAFGGTSALAGTSGVSIAGGAGLTYTGGAATFAKSITVTGGTGSVTNSGSGTLTLSGAISKNGTVLRLAGGAFNVTGLITGTAGGSDLVVEGAAVTLSNTNTYNGPTFVYNSGSLALGVNNGIPSNSVVTLGDATTRGTLDLGSFSDTISQLVFSGSGGTLRMLGSTTSGVQLVTNGSLSLGSNASLVLTNAGTSAGLYRLISATSITGSFSNANVTGLPSTYTLVYSGTEIDLQRKADQAMSFTLSSGTVTRALVNTTVALSGSLSNTAAAGSAALAVSLSSAGTLSVTGLSSGTTQASPQTWTSVAGTLNAGATTGTLSWAVVNTDPNAITTTSTATGTLNVVAERTFTTSTAALNIGVAHVGGSFTGYGSPTVVVTSTGLYATTASATAGAFAGGPSGFSLAQTGGTNAFNGAAATQSGTFTLSGAGLTATPGVLSGTFTSVVAGEFGGIPNIAVAVTGGVFSGTGTWNVAGGGAWGSGASANWTSTGGVGAAPGTFAGFTNTDTAIFAGAQGGTSTILLNGVSPSLASIAFTNSSCRYAIAQGSGGALTLAAAAGTPTVSVATGGTHEIAARILGSAGLEKTGGGTLVLSGSNALSGIVTVTGGTLALGADQSLDGIAGAGVINLGTANLTTGSATSTFSGRIVGSGGLTKAGPGTLTLSGSNAFTGDTNLTGGTLVLAGARALPTDAVVTMGAGATLQLSGTTVVGAIEQNGGTITGGALVASLVSTQSGALNSAIENIVVNGTTYAAGILKRGAGTTTVGGANTFTGSIKLQGGTLQLSGSGSFDAASSLVMSSSATMDLNGKSQTFANLTGSGGTVALGGGQLTLANVTDGLFAGTISGSGSLVKSGAGRLELTGVNTYTGQTAVQAGELKLNGSVASSLVSLAAGTTLSGTGSIAGDAMISGLHSPGNSPGIQTVGGSLTYSGGSGVTWELADNTADLADRGIDFDGINVGANLTFSGSTTLNLTFNNSGSLVNWNDPFWTTDKKGTDGWLVYGVTGSTTGLSNFSVSGSNWLDAGGNWLLDVLPYATFGLEQVGGDVYLTFVAVPEPSSLVLLGIGAALAGLAARRRGRVC